MTVRSAKLPAKDAPATVERPGAWATSTQEVTVAQGSKRAYGTGSLYRKGDDWYGRWRTPDGRRHARRIGTARTNTNRAGLTKRDAEGKLRGILAEDTGVPIEPTTVRELGALLLLTLEQGGRKPSHIESVGYHLRNHINPLLGDLRVGDVSKQDVRRLTDKLLQGGKAAKTVRNVAGTLHSVLALAIDRELLRQNPCDMSKLPKSNRDQTLHFLTVAELESLLEAGPLVDAPQIEHDWWPVLRLMMLAAATTGLRKGELLALRWGDLDMKATKVRVRRSFVRGQYGTPKSHGSVRAVPLGSWLLGELDEHHKKTPWNQDDDLVFAHPHTGRPLDHAKSHYRYKDAIGRAGVRGVKFHDLRHTFATQIAASGVPLRTLQEWMGHEHATTTQIYAHYMPGEQDSALIDSVFGGGQLVAKIASPRTTEQVSEPGAPVNIA